MRWKLAVFTLSLGLGASFGAASPAFAQQSGVEKATKMNVVKTFSVDESDDGTYVRIRGSANPTFSVYKLTSPLRLLIDVSNSELGGEPKTERVNNGVISQVAMLEFKDSVQSITRVIVGFDEAAHYDVRTEGNDVVVFVDGAKRTLDSGNVAEVQRELEKSQSRIAEIEGRYQRELASSESEVNRTRAELERAETELAALRGQLSDASGQQRGDLEREIARRNAAIGGLKSKAAEQEKALAALRREVADLQTERDKALALANQKEREGAAAQKRVSDLEGRLASAEGELVRAERDAANARKAVEARAREIEDAKRREASLEKQLAALRSNDTDGSSQAAIAQLERERRELASTLSSRQSELERARSEAGRANGHLKELQSQLSSRDAEISRLKREIVAAKKSASTARNERVSALENAVERERQRVAALETARASERTEGARERKVLQERLAQLEGELQRARSAREGRPAARAVPVRSNALKGIRLENADGRSRIVVDLERAGSFQTMQGSNSRAVMILNGVDLPADLEKTLAASSAGGAVRFVSTYKDSEGRVRLEAELSTGATEVVRQEGSKLVWEFAPTTSQYAQDRGYAPRQQTRPADGQTHTSAPPRYPRVVTDPTQVSSVPGMSRKRLTIDLREADIQNVLRLLAKEGGVNIVSGAGVGGAVTLRLRSVPLDEVFLTVLQSQSLGFERRGNVIRVAPQETLRKEQEARAEQRARNQVQKPLEVFLMPVNYAEAGKLQAQVKPLLSPRGSVSVDERTNTLVIKDIADNLAAVRSLVANLDAQVPQVLIEARIVETNDTFAQQFGIQWGGDVTFSQANGNPTGLIFPGVLGLAGGATDGQTPTAGTTSTPNFAVNLPAPAGTGSGGSIGLTLGSVGGAVNLALRLSAMEQAGHAKLISSPKILTLDNREATISQGTSIPISVVSAAGVQTVFVDATLELRVMPHVTPDGNIQLTITVAKNEPDFQNTGARGDPTIIRKNAETELLIKDGDTTVIGGVFTRNSGSAYSAVPFLHKIPILGFFFRTTTESDRRTELLIFITPKIVNRTAALGPSGGGTIGGEGE